MFSQACVKNSVHREGCAWRRGNVWQGGGLHGGGGGHAWQGVYVAEVHFRSIVRAGETATKAGGMHPTGMHSCSCFFFKLYTKLPINGNTGLNGFYNNKRCSLDQESNAYPTELTWYMLLNWRLLVLIQSCSINYM